MKNIIIILLFIFVVAALIELNTSKDNNKILTDTELINQQVIDSLESITSERMYRYEEVGPVLNTDFKWDRHEADTIAFNKANNVLKWRLRRLTTLRR